MKKLNIAFLMMMVLVLIIPSAVSAQDAGAELLLGLTRNFGYGGLGKIQGNFTLYISDPPAELERVEFYVGEALVFSTDTEPYKYKFHTSEFDDGQYQMYAFGYLADGTKLETRRITKGFISSNQAWGETQQLIVPILIGTAVLTVLGIAVPLVFNQKKDFVLGKYGPAGGVICPRCELPFSRSVLSPNLVAGKLVRCPHCSKISIQARASRSRLEEAENRFNNLDPTGVVQSAEENLSKLIDDSRFEE